MAAWVGYTTGNRLQRIQVVAQQSQPSHRREVVLELLEDELAHGETGRPREAEIDTPVSRTRRVIGRRDQPQPIV